VEPALTAVKNNRKRLELTSNHGNENNWNATFNLKFEAKLEGQSQSFRACEEQGQSVNHDIRFGFKIALQLYSFQCVQ
jgi:hypothetical protein